MVKKFAVIGHPISHTMSPFIHTRLFGLRNIDVEYLTLDIEPEQLAGEISGCLAPLTGYNVTIPHKENIIPHLNEIHESAKKYNAVNCVINKDGRLYGYSTDAYGFTRALESAGVKLSGRVLVLGAGGAARTLAREAADNGCDITIAVRESDYEKANQLKGWLVENGGKANVKLLNDITGEFDLCINATPVGMYPNTDAAVLTEEQLSHCKALFDAVYNPERTKLIRMAENLGIKAVGGMAMLVWQAAKAHEYWYGAVFTVNEIEEIIAAANKGMERIFYAK